MFGEGRPTSAGNRGVPPVCGRGYWIAMGLLFVGTEAVLIRFLGSLTSLVDFATIVSFLTAPVGGLYFSATDTAPTDGNVLTINLPNSTPADGSAATVTSGGAVVIW